MDERRFWELIAESQRRAARDPHRQMIQLRERLAQLAPDEVLEFGAIFWRLHGVAYRANLWGAASLIGGGCSDDGFDYFRGWLIAQGKAVYETALQDPDSLVDLAEEDETELEEMLSVAPDVYHQLTGSDDFYRKIPLVGRVDIPDSAMHAWSDGYGNLDPDKARRVYPRLYAKFGQFWEK
jgi:hypothetical protein